MISIYPLVIWHLKKSCEPPYFFHWYHWFRTWFRHLLRQVPKIDTNLTEETKLGTGQWPGRWWLALGCDILWLFLADVAMTIDVIYEYMCICSVCMFMYAYMYTWIRGIVCDLNYDWLQIIWVQYDSQLVKIYRCSWWNSMLSDANIWSKDMVTPDPSKIWPLA